MANVTRLFHVIHVVDDLGAADTWYERVFSPRFFFRGHYSPVEERDASIFAVGDFVLEPMMSSRKPCASSAWLRYSRWNHTRGSLAFGISPTIWNSRSTGNTVLLSVTRSPTFQPYCSRVICPTRAASRAPRAARSCWMKSRSCRPPFR